MTTLPRRLGIKFGTKNLTNGSPKLDPAKARDYARQIIELKRLGTQVFIVSSGAIQAGRQILRQKGITAALHKKDLAALGTAALMDFWEQGFACWRNNIALAQILVTHGNWKNPRERQSIQSSLAAFLQCGIVPVINENDVVSQREIDSMERGISENDCLHRMISILMDADAALFLTDVEGIYIKNPKPDSAARFYQEVPAETTAQELGITESVSAQGTGGMLQKYTEASQCASKGMRVAIAGNQPDAILQFAFGEPVGTLIGKAFVI